MPMRKLDLLWRSGRVRTGSRWSRNIVIVPHLF
jgi:hypothetical protein